jgi:hypothetical protein
VEGQKRSLFTVQQLLKAVSPELPPESSLSVKSLREILKMELRLSYKKTSHRFHAKKGFGELLEQAQFGGNLRTFISQGRQLVFIDEFLSIKL